MTQPTYSPDEVYHRVLVVTGDAVMANKQRQSTSCRRGMRRRGRSWQNSKRRNHDHRQDPPHGVDVRRIGAR